MKFLGIAFEEGALEKNIGCAKTAEFFTKKNNGELIEEKDYIKAFEQIEKKATKLFKKEKTLIIGGDHSISFPAVTSFKKINGEKSAFIVFDAHADCYQDFLPPTHEDLNQALINQKILSPENILIVGLRKIFPSERKFLTKHKITTISSKKIKNNLIETKKILQDFCKNKKIYVSIDVDVIDPEEISATGYIEKNGLYLKQLKELLKTLKNIKTIDLVEFNWVNANKKEKEKIKRLVEFLKKLLID